jgi:hypothetical protein
MARSSQERHRKKRTILGKVEDNAEMVRYRQLDTPLQKTAHEKGNGTKKRKKKIIRMCIQAHHVQFLLSKK